MPHPDPSPPPPPGDLASTLTGLALATLLVAATFQLATDRCRKLDWHRTAVQARLAAETGLARACAELNASPSSPRTLCSTGSPAPVRSGVCRWGRYEIELFRGESSGDWRIKAVGTTESWASGAVRRDLELLFQPDSTAPAGAHGDCGDLASTPVWE